MLARGSRRLKDKVLHLVKWTLEVGRLLKGGFAKEVWVRVLGLPLYLWSWEVHKKLGHYCGGFVIADEDTTLLSHLQWVSILVRADGRAKPNSLQVVVGSSSFPLQLWWEAPPNFSLGAQRSGNSDSCKLEVERGVEGDPHTGVGVGKEGLSWQLISVDMLQPCDKTTLAGEVANHCS
ncbi:hypothetical protein CK203_100814 [Vitis vinifera]|uniref:Uncharacterized protein n=1 Tax=Vitis vinifera TaxID=29760 RepID=A0A438CKI6_VITVI|nr:hypothetical protein CK203_100814 [Vitis vinifera]